MVAIKIGLVMITVLVTLFTAMLLNYGAKVHDPFSLSAGIIVFIVLSINFVKFKVWGLIYKRYHLNESYPLIALFFPLVYLFAIYTGEAALETKKIAGISFIILGTIVMHIGKVKI